MNMSWNNIKYYTFVFLCFVSLSSFSNDTDTKIENMLSETPEGMLGLWYGEVTFDTGMSQRWITDRKRDGSFKTEYRFYKNKELSFTAVVLGKWGANNKYYNVSSLEAFENGVAVPIRKEMELMKYSIIKLSDEEFQYEEESSGNEFIVRKISERPSIFIPESQQLEEGQYYLSSTSGIHQLTLDNSQTVRVIGLGQMRSDGQVGVYVAYESLIDFDKTTELENQIRAVVTSLNEYIKSTGLEYCFVEAREPKPDGVIKQYRSYRASYKKSNDNWQEL